MFWHKKSVINAIATIAIPLLCSVSLPGWAETTSHALIISVSGYERSPLDGVVKDRESAEQLAKRFGVAPANIKHVAEKAVTIPGVKQAISELNQRLMPGDKLYVFFSGHGARRLNPYTGQCSESLVMQNMELLSNEEFAELLKPLGRKADKVFVMLDACHSGGVASVAASYRTMNGNKKRAKFYAKADEAQQCSQATNLKQFTQTRGLEIDNSNMNLVVIAAAKNTEVAWDGDDGGAMMTNFTYCVQKGVPDTDRSGVVTMRELADCVQQRLDQEQDPAMRQHVVLTGNSGLIPGFNVQPLPVPPSPTPNTDASLAALTDIYNQRDERWQVNAVPSKTQLRIGQDELNFNITSQYAGYVYVFYRGSHPDSFYLLYPNALDNRNQINAGETLSLPRPEWRIKAMGPEGRDHLLVLVTQNPRDFSAYALPREYVNPAGAFQKVQTNSNALAAITRIASMSNSLKQGVCQANASSGNRDLAVAQACSDRFGAAWFTLDEVR